MAYNYLVDLTFFAGSDQPEDVDHKLYVITSNHFISRDKMAELFATANKNLSPYMDDMEEVQNSFLTSYDNGLNIDTLMEGFNYLAKTISRNLFDGCGEIENINDYYVIEQWQ